MNLWSKTIRALISTGSDDCLILAYLLIEDRRSLHYYWYAGDAVRTELKLPPYVHYENLLEIMKKFFKLSVQAHTDSPHYLRNLKARLDASVE